MYCFTGGMETVPAFRGNWGLNGSAIILLHGGGATIAHCAPAIYRTNKTRTDWPIIPETALHRPH